jgi:hypothetical protein
MMAPHSKVTVCRMARHAGLFILEVRSSRVTCGELTSSSDLDDYDPRRVYSTQPAPESIVVELSFEPASPCGHSTSASPDSNGTGVHCHVRGIWRHVVERNSCAFSTPESEVEDEVQLLEDFGEDFRPSSAGLTGAVARPQTDSVASDSAVRGIQDRRRIWKTDGDLLVRCLLKLRARGAA